ncbi:MAG TPA: TMEM175 family protein [Candidatus Eremiobacteraceae bacterium]|nr:TMEM175 family protein [Candidatus Eremiobacteraceae bacterium]
MTPSRIEQFADGIFAISATLLVLNFTVPALGNASSGALAHGLASQWPRLLAFLLSFFIIVNYWRLHSAMFHNVRVLDHTTVMLNIGFLVVAAFIPYATNVAGAYPTLPAAAVLYSIVLLTGALFGFFMVRHLIESRAYAVDVTPELARVTYSRIRFSLYIRVVGLIFAFFLPVISYLIYWVMIIYFLSFSAIDNLG